MSATTVSRRNLVKGAAIGAAALGAAAVTTTSAMADEPADSYTYADTVAWDAEYDVVVLGMGFAGLASAMDAADAGASVLLAEKLPDGEAGGNSRVCGQMFAYGNEDYDNTLAYYRALTGGRSISDAYVETIAKGISSMATTLSEKYGFNSDEFVHVTSLGLGMYDPEYPEFPGAEVMNLCATHDAFSDSYVYQTMRARLADNYMDKIDVWFASPAVSLYQDPVSKTVVGVAIDRNGATRNVRALNGVCVCTGGFEDDHKMVQDFIGEINFAKAGSLNNTGDGIKMCLGVGARLWHMAAWEGNAHKYYGDPDSVLINLPDGVYNGAGMIVGDWGKRFFNETEAARHQHYSGGNGIWENLHYPQNLYAVFDATQMGVVEEAGGINPDYADTLTECDTVAEAAAVIGCEEADLQKQIDDFNLFVEMGEDFEFHRDIDTMRAFDGEKYYVIRLLQTLLNTQGGPERNENGEILDMEGNVIPNLYSAGEMGALTTCMYQGGSNVAECFIMGQIAGTNAATPKGSLPAYTIEPKVESNPAHLGDETDLVAD